MSLSDTVNLSKQSRKLPVRYKEEFKMKLPSYPIATIDPHFSIWSKADSINADDTYLWCGIRKRIEGTLTLDGEKLTFLGKNTNPAIPQTDCIITPYVSDYIFENDKVRLRFRTWTPFLFDDFSLFSLPVSYFETTLTSLDGEKHDAEISFTCFDELCTGKKKAPVNKHTESFNCVPLIKMGLINQKPLNDSGDTFAADWGYVCLMGGKVKALKEGISVSQSKCGMKRFDCSFILAYDDVLSINYFGEKLKGLWTESFSSIEEGMKYCLDNKKELFDRIRAQEKMIISDASGFGKAYTNMLSAAARQVLAGHKLVRSAKDGLLYLSKECHSNGCINTVDVSYPAVPMYLIYAPELVKAMLTGIFRFADSDLWQADYAPHDIGRYPIACGQVYALANPVYLANTKRSYPGIYKSKSFKIYTPLFQMPVEECGNMLILSWAYYTVSKDKNFLRDNYYTLSTWAKYLIDKGVVLDNQLCTDDFAGHSKKNVNLAIKGIMGIACFAEISDTLQIKCDAMETAKAYADELISLCGEGEYLPFSLDKKDSWSLKYNLVWDELFSFNLFDKKYYKGESEKYTRELNAFGVPLDYRKTLTKTDWMLWAACLDETDRNVGLFSEKILAYLAATRDKTCFSDWIDTKEARQWGFDHRTVQAGLWMPVLKKKMKSAE